MFHIKISARRTSEINFANDSPTQWPWFLADTERTPAWSRLSSRSQTQSPSSTSALRTTISRKARRLPKDPTFLLGKNFIFCLNFVPRLLVQNFMQHLDTKRANLSLSRQKWLTARSGRQNSPFTTMVKSC